MSERSQIHDKKFVSLNSFEIGSPLRWRSTRESVRLHFAFVEWDPLTGYGWVHLKGVCFFSVVRTWHGWLAVLHGLGRESIGLGGIYRYGRRPNSVNWIITWRDRPECHLPACLCVLSIDFVEFSVYTCTHPFDFHVSSPLFLSDPVLSVVWMADFVCLYTNFTFIYFIYVVLSMLRHSFPPFFFPLILILSMHRSMKAQHGMVVRQTNKQIKREKMRSSKNGIDSIQFNSGIQMSMLPSVIS